MSLSASDGANLGTTIIGIVGVVAYTLYLGAKGGYPRDTVLTCAIMANYALIVGGTLSYYGDWTVTRGHVTIDIWRPILLSVGAAFLAYAQGAHLRISPVAAGVLSVVLAGSCNLLLAISSLKTGNLGWSMFILAVGVYVANLILQFTRATREDRVYSAKSNKELGTTKNIRYMNIAFHGIAWLAIILIWMLQVRTHSIVSESTATWLLNVCFIFTHWIIPAWVSSTFLGKGVSAKHQN